MQEENNNVSNNKQQQQCFQYIDNSVFFTFPIVSHYKKSNK